MSIGNVSFGKVIAVFGKPRKVDEVYLNFNSDVSRHKMIVENQTERYSYASSGGVIAQAVQQKGAKVDIYVTGKDVAKVQQKQKGWENMTSILTHLSRYYDLSKTSVKDTIRGIRESN